LNFAYSGKIKNEDPQEIHTLGRPGFFLAAGVVVCEKENIAVTQNRQHANKREAFKK